MTTRNRLGFMKMTTISVQVEVESGLFCHIEAFVGQINELLTKQLLRHEISYHSSSWAPFSEDGFFLL